MKTKLFEGLGPHGYEPLDGFYDEMCSASGQLRGHWSGFIAQLEEIGSSSLSRRWQEVRRLIRENGVTFNVFADNRGFDRPWELDPLPVLFSQSEWAVLEEGLIQRAHLLERILDDIYGQQELLSKGWLPPELVFCHPGFLRSCHGLCLPPRSRLLLYGCDLARNPAGQMVVLRDRAQAPPGAGYALENRLVVARMLPEPFRECQVARLGPFFQGLRRTLAGLAVRNPENPRIVLLTPGPGSETFFEHAYLAQYLGCTLVEGDDLTVRDDCVFLKLLEGLQPVDVILRRLSDSFCDPLELRGDSLLGVPGLVQAVRSGNVAVANCLGSGWVETPALSPYLANLCRRLLGEELRLEGVPAWWCGDSQGLSHVLANLERMVIRPAFPAQGQVPVFPSELSRQARAELAERMRSRPDRYVGQEQIGLSTVPAWGTQGLESRHASIRAFLSARHEGGYQVMPGGLARVSPTSDSLVVSMQTGGGSKDTWVLTSAEQLDEAPLPQEGPTVVLTRGGGDIPSRAADNLYWLGRYVERVEGKVRLLRGCLVRLTESSLAEVSPEVPVLLQVLGSRPENGPRPRAGLPWCQERILHWFQDDEHPDGLVRLLSQVNRLAGTVRDRISADSWRVLSSLQLPAAPAPQELSDVQLALERLIVTLWAFGGMATESMHRGHGWRFLDTGRRLERALHTCRLLLPVTERQGGSGPMLEAALEICDSSRTYRRRYQVGMSAAPVVDLLLVDETNPRSVAFQLRTTLGHLENLPRDPQAARRSLDQRLILGLLTDLRLLDVTVVCRRAEGGRLNDLRKLLCRIANELPQASDCLTQAYLTHLTSVQLSAMSNEWRSGL